MMMSTALFFSRHVVTHLTSCHAVQREPTYSSALENKEYNQN